VPVAALLDVAGLVVLDDVHGLLLVGGGCHVRNIRAIPTRVKSVDTMTDTPYSPIKHGSEG
jgi:hypothetical protein